MQVGAALDAVMHVRREGPVRRLWEIAAVLRTGESGIVLHPALVAEPDPARGGHLGPGWPVLAERFDLPDPGSEVIRG